MKGLGVNGLEVRGCLAGIEQAATSFDGWVQHTVTFAIVGVAVEVVHRWGGAKISPRLRGLVWRVVVLLSLVPPGVSGLRTRAAPAAGTEVSIETMPTAPILLWAAGVLFSLYLALRGDTPIGRTPRPEERSALVSLFARLRHQAPIRMAIGNDHRLRAPAVIGPLRAPRLWIPEEWLEAERRDDLLRALAHEIAHLVRRDLWRSRALDLWRAIFWFHPIAHLAVRRLDELREVACDRSAAERLGESPVDYGAWLARLALVRGSGMPGTLALGGSSSSFVRRVESVMYDASPERHSFPRRLLEFSALALLLGLVLPPRVDVIASSVTSTAARPPGCLELRYRVMAELAEQNALSPPTIASR